jgi:hypothetical protein
MGAAAVDVFVEIHGLSPVWGRFAAAFAKGKGENASAALQAGKAWHKSRE